MQCKHHVWFSLSLCFLKYSWPCHTEVPNAHPLALQHTKLAHLPAPLAHPLAKDHAWRFTSLRFQVLTTVLVKMAQFSGTDTVLKGK
jgi:hypothetical protein